MAAVSDIKIHFRTCMHQPGEKLLIKWGILGIIIFHFRSLRGGGCLKIPTVIKKKIKHIIFRMVDESAIVDC